MKTIVENLLNFTEYMTMYSSQFRDKKRPTLNTYHTLQCCRGNAGISLFRVIELEGLLMVTGSH